MLELTARIPVTRRNIIGEIQKVRSWNWFGIEDESEKKKYFADRLYKERGEKLINVYEENPNITLRQLMG